MQARVRADNRQHQTLKPQSVLNAAREVIAEADTAEQAPQAAQTRLLSASGGPASEGRGSCAALMTRCSSENRWVSGARQLPAGPGLWCGWVRRRAGG